MPIRPNWQTATLLQAEETSITSTHTGRTYRIQAATLGERPAGGYPVLYILDGDAFFPAILNMAQSLLINPITKSHAACLIVGIGYTGGTIRDLSQRALDYTPPLPDNAPESERKQYGQADRFSRFIDDELSALLDNKYRIDTQNQAVFGHSFGALYGLYSLFTRPERFRHYLLVSPSIWWQDRRVLDWLPDALPQGIGIRLGAGEHEGRNNRPDQTSRGMVAQAKILAGTLHHLGADVRFTLYPNANHGNAPFYALTDCIEYLRGAWQR